MEPLTRLMVMRPAFKSQVGELEHTDFGRPEAVAVGDGKDGAVALGLDGREKALHFLLGKEGYGAVLFSRLRYCHRV